MAKRYSDFMDEITPDELYDRLIQYGLFSEKLPPVFDGSSFLAYCHDDERIKFSNVPSNYVNYDSMRNINIPRPIGIPTPMSHELLCNCLKDNWSKLQEYFRVTTKNQRHIVSRTHIRKNSDTHALFKMNYENWQTDGTPEIDIQINKKYVVKADISKCFPTIYTHAIPWALTDKSTGKQNKHNKNEWYNKIDHYAQNSNNGETHGLLIGPHTSNLLSEIILCKIDENLCQQGWDYIRHIDDYCCYVKTRDAADKFLIALHTELKKYSLSLNHHKSEIKELPIAMAEEWVRKIQRQLFLFEKFHKYVDFIEIRSFIDFCIELISQSDDNFAILRYGMKGLRFKNLSRNAKTYYLKMAISLSIMYPYLVPILDECIFTPFNINDKAAGIYINILYKEHFKKNFFESVSHLLFYAIKREIEIDDFDIDKIIEKNDCTLLLMSLIYCRKSNDEKSIKKLKKHAKSIREKEEFDSYWIFAYECLPKEELLDNWKNLKEKNVSFLKPEFQFTNKDTKR